MPTSNTVARPRKTSRDASLTIDFDACACVTAWLWSLAEPVSTWRKPSQPSALELRVRGPSTTWVRGGRSVRAQAGLHTLAAPCSGPRMAQRNFDPGFFVEHFLKDMRIALTEAGRYAHRGVVLLHAADNIAVCLRTVWCVQHGIVAARTGAGSTALCCSGGASHVQPRLLLPPR